MISTKEQTLDEFMTSGEGTKSFEEWYRFHNVKDPARYPLVMFSDEWHEELAIFSLDKAGWSDAKDKKDKLSN